MLAVMRENQFLKEVNGALEVLQDALVFTPEPLD